MTQPRPSAPTATAALCLVIATLWPAAGAQAEGAALRPDDVRRMEALDTTLGAAVITALAGGAPPDITRLTAALHGPAVPTAAEALVGDWNCSTLKLGGNTSLLSYPPFKCRISPAEGGAVLLEKLTGSQRVRGLIRAQPDGTLVLAGVAYVAGDTPPDYADLPQSVDPTDTPQILPAPARVEVMDKGRARVLFPQPMVESSFDILSLSR